MEEQFRANPAFQQDNGLQPETMSQILVIVYGSLAGVMLVIGVLRIVAGIGVLRFRGRVFGMVTLVAGLGVVVSCYCLPTSIALAIYGLIVLLDRPVVTAFELGQQGYSSDEIQTAFARLDR
jgi:hypothetical protein